MAEAHIRIDEGLKRGPRMRQGKPTRPSHPADIGTWLIPANLDPDKVIQQYLSEATTSHIAQQYGISRKALTKWIREKRPKEWKQAQIVKALMLKEDSEEGILDANDALSLARNREALKAAQFDLTSLDPEYQPKQQVEVTVDHKVLIEHALAESALELFNSMRGIQTVTVPAIEGGGANESDQDPLPPV